MPYRIDLEHASDDALDRLVALGALDVEATSRGLAALMPDRVTVEHVARAVETTHYTVSPAHARDAGSVWVLRMRPVQVGPFLLVPPHLAAPPGAIRLIDGAAFGSGLHATTALCLEALADAIAWMKPPRVLDVGTGSGILALAALRQGVPRALGLDIDVEALRVAAANAYQNGVSDRVHLVCGGPESVQRLWPLVVANVLAAPLVEMAPALVQRVARGGLLILSGVPTSLVSDVERAYSRLGMRAAGTRSRAGWEALIFQPSW